MSRTWWYKPGYSTTTLFPNSDVLVTGWILGFGGNAWSQLAADNTQGPRADNTPLSLYCGFPNTTITGTIVKVVLYTRATPVNVGTVTYNPLVRTPTANPGPPQVINSVETYAYEMTTNPDGNPWTQTDINNLECGMNFVSESPATANIRFQYMYVEVLSL